MLSLMAAEEITAQHVAELASIDDSDYWWYAVRQEHIEAALAKVAAGGELDFLDLGCGPGGVMASIARNLRPRQLVGLDGTQAAVDVALGRDLDARVADFRKPLEVPFAPNAVTCLDVLEHLEHPAAALENLGRVVTPDALLVITVPAMPSLFSGWDEAADHFRRYTRATLTEHLEAGGWRVERMRYFFSYCVPPAWVQRVLLKRVQEVDFPPVSPAMNWLMTTAGRIERHLGSPMPLGTSLIAEARLAR
jgi:SAM-dependent methyltransferase